MRLGVALLVVLAAARRPSRAQAIVPPRVVAQEFLDAVGSGSWSRVRELTEPNTLWEFITKKRQEWRQFAAPNLERAYTITMADIMQQDSLMPPVVAKYLLDRAVAQQKQFSATRGSLLPGVLADVETVAQMDSLDDAELWARSLRAQDMNYMVRLSARRSGCPEPFGPDSMKFVTKRTVRGVALLSDSEGVALYSEVTGGMELPAQISGGFRQLRLRLIPAGWRVEASDMTIPRNASAFSVTSTRCRAQAPPR